METSTFKALYLEAAQNFSCAGSISLNTDSIATYQQRESVDLSNNELWVNRLEGSTYFEKTIPNGIGVLTVSTRRVVIIIFHNLVQQYERSKEILTQGRTYILRP